MTAPGSEPVSPLPPGLDGAHPTPTQSGDTIPVSFPGTHAKPKIEGPGPTGGPSNFRDMNGIGNRDRWKQST